MASARKKQEEKNMKTLREIYASIPYNKYCFDCNQRGPTYVNITIGSFVCAKCSGILRGLTPPHRVKSISMATFTTEEVEFLKSRGNHYCHLTWLGLFDGNPSEPRDEQANRDFMIDKYERKRYYMDLPEGVCDNAAIKINATPTVVTQNRPIESVPRHNKKVPEFVADFGSADIYNAVSNDKDTNMNDNNKPVGSFSNSSTVANNNVSATSWNFTNFNTSFEQTLAVPNPNDNHIQSSIAFSMAAEKPAHALSAPLEDRYAALKDLDSVFKTQPQFDWNLGSNGSSSPSSSLYSSSSEYGSTYGSSQSMFSQPEVSKTSNPFNIKTPWSEEVQQPSSANPFRTNESNVKVNGITPSMYKSVPFPSNGGSLWSPNPFSLGPSNSSNPFL